MEVEDLSPHIVLGTETAQEGSQFAESTDWRTFLVKFSAEGFQLVVVNVDLVVSLVEGRQLRFE